MRRPIALIVLLTGCASTEGPGTDFLVLDQELLAPARAAADEWCRSTDGRCCPTVDGGDNTIALTDDLGNPGWAAKTVIRRDRWTRIEVLSGYNFEDQRALLRHEFGHACRAANNPDRVGVAIEHLPEGNAMAPDAFGTEYSPLTKADIAYATETL
jgi:hypothetical protein